jgi:hypothetical protein
MGHNEEHNWPYKKGAVMVVTNIVASSNSAHGKVYLIQHYEIKFVSELPQD